MWLWGEKERPKLQLCMETSAYPVTYALRLLSKGPGEIHLAKENRAKERSTEAGTYTHSAGVQRQLLGG